MLIGLGDGGGRKKPKCVDCGAGGAHREKRRAKALRQLEAAHAAGTLGAFAGGLGDLGDLDPNTLFPDRTDIDREETAFDVKLNAWLVDVNAGVLKIPASVSQQIDEYFTRWRDFHAGWYLIGRTRVSQVLAYQQEWNRLRDQVAGYGATTAIEAATVTVDGKTVRADQIPPGSSTLERIETPHDVFAMPREML